MNTHPPPGLLDRLLRSVQAAGPLAPFLERVAALLDLPPPQVRPLLRRFEQTDGWSQPFPGVEVLRVTPGDDSPGPSAALLRLAPRSRFPMHTHTDPERLLVLRGSCTQTDGAELGPGQHLDSAPGSAHAFDVHDQEMLAVVVYGHIDWG